MKPVPVERKTGPKVTDYVPVYMKACVTNKRKPSTIASKRSNFHKWIAPPEKPGRPIPDYALTDLYLMDVTTKKVNKLKEALASIGASAANNVLGNVSALLHHAIENEIIDVMPCRIKLFPELRTEETEAAFYEHEAFHQLQLAAADGHAVMVYLGAHAGLRAGEIAGLEWPDIDWKRRLITVQRAVWEGIVGLPKGNKIRRVPMSRTLYRVLRAYRHLRGPRVLYQVDGSPVDRDVLSEWLADCELAAGLSPDGLVHRLRHTFCSHLALANVPPHIIQRLAGHFDLKITGRYLHLSPSNACDAVLTLDAPSDAAAEAEAQAQLDGDILETALARLATG
jgi:integrase